MTPEIAFDSIGFHYTERLGAAVQENRELPVSLVTMAGFTAVIAHAIELARTHPEYAMALLDSLDADEQDEVRRHVEELVRAYPIEAAVTQ